MRANADEILRKLLEYFHVYDRDGNIYFSYHSEIPLDKELTNKIIKWQEEDSR